MRTVGGPGEETEDRCRGLAFFLAFDPWETSLKCPPGSVRFFDVAERTGLLSADEARNLSQTLIRHASEMSRVYNGAFSPFFSDPHVRTILNNVDHLESLSESALAIGGSWADLLFENCPFPLQPTKHLEVQSFRQITTEDEIEFYSQTPWLAWCEALDLICLGPWAGLSPAGVTNVVKALEQKVVRLPPQELDLEDAVFGRKVTVPMFSRGLQGAVVGLFTDVPKDQMEPILTSLVQFGETVSDMYADLRWKYFVQALEGDLDEEALAREVINVVSPVARLVVRREDRKAGYKIGYEQSYWSGYEPLSRDEFEEDPSDHGFSVAGPGGAAIYIEPIADISHINPAFTRIRLENYLNQTFSSISLNQLPEALEWQDVQKLRAELEAYVQDADASLAKLRQYYVARQVERQWDNGSVTISNNELKSFMESQGRDAKTGYQVTSYAAEFEKMFAGKVTATKTRNALSLSWIKGG